MTQCPSWKRHQIRKKWQNIISVFVTVVLVFAIFNGLTKGFALKKNFFEGRWDGTSAFTIAINSSNPSVFIFQKDPKKIVILTIDGTTNYETGNIAEPIKEVSVNVGSGGNDLAVALSKIYRVKIDNYLTLKREAKMDEDFSRQLFKNFASFLTPFKILTGTKGNIIADTNITRKDAFMLWWQVKGLSIENINLTDMSAFREPILTQNESHVLGADTDYLMREASKYLENLKIIKEDNRIRIVNASGVGDAGRLASDFVTGVGGRIEKVENSKDFANSSTIYSRQKNSYTLRYLANVFMCDIKDTPKEADSGEITIVLGRDFAKSYFK